MTPPLRSLAADIRYEAGIASRSGQCDRLDAIAAKLESLAGEYAVVPREPTAAMCMAANDAFPVSGETTCSEIGRTIYRAMLAAAERQETGR